MKKTIILFSLLFFTHITFGKSFYIKPLEIENPGIPLNIRFLTTGSIVGNKYLRVAILVEERVNVSPNIAT